jgi:cell division protein YceG involved in septum cleavage
MQSRSLSVKRFNAAIAVVLFVGVISVLRFMYYFNAAHSPSSGVAQEIIIEIHKGQTPHEIAKLLVKEDLISDLERFIWAGRVTRKWKKN